VGFKQQSLFPLSTKEIFSQLEKRKEKKKPENRKKMRRKRFTTALQEQEL